MKILLKAYRFNAEFTIVEINTIPELFDLAKNKGMNILIPSNPASNITYMKNKGVNIPEHDLYAEYYDGYID